MKKYTKSKLDMSKNSVEKRITMIDFLKWIGNVLLRMVFGAIGIFAMNAIFFAISKNIVVGINIESMATIGLLGAPGFILLYAVSVYVNEA